tara:strand:- start:973 stop:1113 length:141 start_codon:yes stop_codon:yes gene_type:complete
MTKDIEEFWKLLKKEEDLDTFIDNSKVLIYVLENDVEFAMSVDYFF